MSMITQRPVLSQLPRRVATLAFAALLVLGLPLAAQHAHGGGGGGGSHGGGGGGHTAHGVPGGGSSGGGQRQPGGHGGHGGGYYHGGHGYYGHGYYGHGYYPYYYPYYGWGWPNFSFYWGYPYYDGYPYGYGYYGPYDGNGDGYPDGGGYGYDGGYNGGGPMGALDLDVSPGNTHVFVNGQDLGEVDKYDGWPGYLWLPRGTYDIAFYLDGFKTIARQITIYPGNVIDIDDRMEQGPSTRPEDLISKSHERRDARLQYEQQRSEQIDRQQAYEDDQQQDWHNRVRQDHHGQGNVPAGSRGHLRLSVEPNDASVYLDGQFVGTGTDLSMLRGGLAVGPGAHHLAVVRPGHKAAEKDFTVQSGEEVQLDIALEAGSH
jgi:PEGA domain